MAVEPDHFRDIALAELDAVYRLAHHLASQPGEADDLVQETYLRAFKSAGSFKPNDHGIRPWLFKILHNVLNTRLAHDQRQRLLTDSLKHEPVPDSARIDDSLPDLANLDWEVVDERLKAAIAELSTVHRMAFLLCAVEGLSYQEIADVLEVPIGTVMSRLYRARLALAERLGELAAEQGMGKSRPLNIREIPEQSKG